MEKKRRNRQHVFIIGCKGIPAQYGGFETFADKLTEYQRAADIQYHIACACEPQEYDRSRARYRYHKAKCYVFPWRKLGAARAVAYDIDALRYFIQYAEKNRIPHPVFYILACRIGPFIGYFKKRIDELGGQLFVNPDGHEFLRAKWSPPVQKYWKFSERLMVKHAGLLVCDSLCIEKYIQTEYARYHPKTVYIAYGAETAPSVLSDRDEALTKWYQANGIEKNEYYLVVGRFVPENNYETMIREFMKSGSKKAFVLITDVNGEFLEKLRQRTGFDTDSRIRFAGTVYDRELLKKIRENAYGYFHGHEVGGTNPSLLEAMAAAGLNLLLDVGFNREAAQDGAFYWTKKEGNLASLIEEADVLDEEERKEMGRKARERIQKHYSWEYIADRYEGIFHCGRGQETGSCCSDEV